MVTARDDAEIVAKKLKKVEKLANDAEKLRGEQHELLKDVEQAQEDFEKICSEGLPAGARVAAEMVQNFVKAREALAKQKELSKIESKIDELRKKLCGPPE